MPMRVSRYPEDYCHQLEELGAPSGEPIERRDPDRFIDEDLFTFSLPHETRRAEGRRQDQVRPQESQSLSDSADSRGAELVLGFGVRIETRKRHLSPMKGTCPVHRHPASCGRRPMPRRVLDRSREQSSRLSAAACGPPWPSCTRRSLCALTSPKPVELCLQLTSGSGDSEH